VVLLVALLVRVFVALLVWIVGVLIGIVGEVGLTLVLAVVVVLVPGTVGAMIGGEMPWQAAAREASPLVSSSGQFVEMHCTAAVVKGSLKQMHGKSEIPLHPLPGRACVTHCWTQGVKVWEDACKVQASANNKPMMLSSSMSCLC